ncbi:MAG: tetratricopeptide repeat protein [Bacteroidia bacterium]|nr:tetratricopeptide repeat protein [Bacteroidia bacterium]MCX7651463.1 tetratricopeptide repeat protein [Bacteroidia bacterium]MDW8416782.1 tetratricopeptide repeat protein [Bacteroidia bacterium]
MAEEQVPNPGTEAPPKAQGIWMKLWNLLQQRRVVNFITIGIVIIVVGWVAFREYRTSKNEECVELMRFAEAYFRQDSFEKAIKGTLGAPGFEQLVEEYGWTQAGNLCRLYLGLCYLKLNKPREAVEVLSAYDAPDSYLGGAAYAALAGAYGELKDFSKSAKYYEKAADIHNNSQTSPVFLLQAALSYELAKENDKAAKLYERILKEYPTAGESNTAQKHLERVRLLR